MSGRLGTCAQCHQTVEGIYSMDVCRGWTDDRYNFSVEICEPCLDKMTAGWTLGTQSADHVYVEARSATFVQAFEEMQEALEDIGTADTTSTFDGVVAIARTALARAQAVRPSNKTN